VKMSGVARWALALAVAGTAFGAAASLGVASGLPTLLRADVTSDFSVRPATMSFGASADLLIGGQGVSAQGFKSGRYGHIRWTVWTKSRASGEGTLWINSCTPNCATGTYVPRPVTLNASDVQEGRFRDLLLLYKFNGRRVHDRRLLTLLTGTNTPAYQWFTRG
jgi:hypothetical protein